MFFSRPTYVAWILFGRKLALISPLLFSAAILSGCGASSSASDSLESTRISSPEPATNTEMPTAAHETTMEQSAMTSSNQVVIDNFAFRPAELTISRGSKVTWRNRDDVPHTATSTTKPRAFDSHSLDTDEQFSHTFATSGTYEYFCALHPHMTGKIIVK
jgi:plastocyanin